MKINVMEVNAMKRSVMMVAVCVAAVVAKGAGIVWDTDSNGESPYRITDEQDVRTDGALVYAYGGTAVTVNTVAFALFTGNPDIDTTLTSGPYNGYSSEGISAPYSTLITHGVYRDGNSPHTVTLKNLTVGAYYLVQFWVSDTRSSGTTRSELLSSVGGNTVRVDFQNTAQGALKNGQYAIGYFIADDVTQVITVTANNGQMNAIQVRQLPSGDKLLVKADLALMAVATLLTSSQLVSPGGSFACEMKALYGYKIVAVYTNNVLFASLGNDLPFVFVLEDVQDNITISADVVRDFSVPPSYVGNSGNWSDTTKWTSGLVADNGATARFVTLNSQTITVDTPVLLGGLYMTQHQTFNASGGGSLTFADGAEIRAYTANNTTTFNQPLFGTGGTITKRGSGAVGNNNGLNMRFTQPFENFGMVNLMGGLLESTAAGSVAISTGNVTLAGSRLTIAPSAATAAQTIAGDGTFTVGPGPNMITLAKHSGSPSFSLTLGGALTNLPGGMLPLNRAGWDGNNTKIFLAQPPALVNGILPPWMASVNGVSERIHFVTHDATDGIVDAPTKDYSVAGATDIAVVSADADLADKTAFYALEVNNATATLYGTLTLGDGASPAGIILNSGILQHNTVDIGDSDLYIWNMNHGNSRMNSTIQGNGGSVSFSSGMYPNYGESQNLRFAPPSPGTYTGPTYISGTRVEVITPYSPFGPGDIYVYGNESRVGGQVYFSQGANFTFTNNLHISGLGADQSAAIRIQEDVPIQGTIEVMDYAGIQTQRDSARLDGLIYGPGKLRLRGSPSANGTDSFTLTNANIYAGGSEIFDTTVQLDNIEGLSTGAVELMGTVYSRLRFNNAEDWVYTNTLLGAGSLAKINDGRVTIADFRGQSANMINLSITGGDMTLPNSPWRFLTTTMNPASTLAIQPGPVRTFLLAGNNGFTSSLASVSGPASLTKDFFNRLLLDGDNTYSGATKVDFGSIQAMRENTLPAATALSVNNLSTLDLNGFSQTVGSLSGKGWVVNTNAAAPHATFTFGDAQDSRFEGYIAGNSSLVKQGPGTATLASANTYSGDTTILGGTLKLSAFDRSSPQTPAEIADVSLWLDASNPASLSALDTDPVSLWKDLTPNGYAFETSRDNRFTQPTVDGGKLNGKNMVKFARAQKTRLEAWDYTEQPNIRSFAAVLILTDADGGGVGGSDGIFGRAALNPASGADNGIRRGTMNFQGYALNWAGDFLDNNNCFVNGKQTLGFINLEPFFVVTGRTRSDNIFSDMSLGGFYEDGRCFSGWIGEIIGFSTTLTTIQRWQVEGYLREKWFTATDPNSAASGDILPVTTGLTLRNGATLDLGGTAQTVASLTGSGIVTNGTLTITDRLVINVNSDGTYDDLTIAGTLVAGPNAVLEITNAERLSGGRVIIPCDALDGAFDKVIPSKYAYTFANGEIRLTNRATMILIK